MNKSRNLKNRWPQFLFSVFIYFGSFFLPFILMAIFKIENYAFILLVWGITCFYYYIIYRIGTELFWISKCLFNEKEKEWYAKEALLYHFLCEYDYGEILKTGMTLEELQKEINSSEWATDGAKEYSSFLWERTSGLKDGNKKNKKIIIRGFGHEMPTPKLILRFKQGKLVSWRDTGESEFKWH